MKKTTIYAAYGSNMNLGQMAFRCPNSTSVGTGRLQGYQLLFRGRDGSAVATVEPKEGSTVPVLVWKITEKDEQILDYYEGLPTLYRKETLTVRMDDKTMVRAMVYIMNEGWPLGAPSGRYYKGIADGYKAAGLKQRALAQAVSESIPDDLSLWETPAQREERELYERYGL